MNDVINSIKRKNNGEAIVVKEKIGEGCHFENTAVEGFGTIIIDKEFIDNMIEIANSIKFDGSFIKFLADLDNKIYTYYYSKSSNILSREKTIFDLSEMDEEGMIIGTKISSLKGKNIAKCSEKSIAAYIVLQHFYNTGKITRKPSMIISNLSIVQDESKIEPHAFLTMDKETDNYPTKHILWDIENPTEVADVSGKVCLYPGIYALSDEEKEKIYKGYECSPRSLHEFYGTNRILGGKRIYGCRKIDLARENLEITDRE